MAVQASIYVFDAYGTLFDVHSAAARFADGIGEDWGKLSDIWRTKQLEYCFVNAGADRWVPFEALTEQSLDYAIAVTGGAGAAQRDELLKAYRSLDAYAEVGDVLRELKDRDAKLAILSNGDPDMLADAEAAAGLGGLFDAVLSVSEVGVFKPAMRVYQMACQRFGAEPTEIAFQSSNRWDIAGARYFGMRTNWINRTGKPDEYPDLPPDAVFSDLTGLLAEG